MIARLWRGWTARSDAERYAAILYATGVPAYRAIEGNQGVHVLRRDEGERTEFLLVSLWYSMEAVRRFAGPQPEVAVFYPEDEGILVERETRVLHYHVVERS